MHFIFSSAKKLYLIQLTVKVISVSVKEISLILTWLVKIKALINNDYKLIGYEKYTLTFNIHRRDEELHEA